MYVHVTNENYGYAVSTHDPWVIVGNPSTFVTGSTGSVDIFKYNTLSDQHDLLITLYKPLGTADELDLARDDDALFIHTDIAKSVTIPIFSSGFISVPITFVIQDIPIKIDVADYVENIRDSYGYSIDVYNNVLSVGDKDYLQHITYGSTDYFLSGSSVDIYNLTALHSNFLDGFIATGSNFLAQTISPPATDIGTGSFGYSVSVNDEWLAVGSPYFLAKGGVHLYRRTNPGDLNTIEFSYFSTITGSLVKTDDLFGHSIHLNKQTASYSSSLVVGCGRTETTSSFVFYFEFDGSNWKEINTFFHDLTPRDFPFFATIPVRDTSSLADSYGYSVALWQDDIVVGAPTDRVIYEFSGSNLYNEGAVYFYHRCPDHSMGWYLVEKSYGNEKTLKNNRLGISVDIWNDYTAVGVPKYNYNSLSSCYEEGATWQLNYCNNDAQDYAQGQWILYNRNTSSADLYWDILNVYQKKKRFLEPYRAFGFDVAIANFSAVVGAPLILADTTRSINIQNTGSIQGDTFLPLQDYSGKAYIYNLHNLREEYHVGNVFYRNGKVVLNTSGSLFSGIWFNPINEDNYEYEIHFDSKQTLYEKQIACVVEPGEFNTSTNPTALVRIKAIFDINNNGVFDWQDVDVILRYMQSINTRYTTLSTNWSSSLITTDEEQSVYDFYSSNYLYNTGADYISQSFFSILNTLGISQFDFNQDSKIDLNDMNIFWKYSINRLNQVNYQSYITPNSKRRLFSDIIDYLDICTQRKSSPEIKPEFLTYAEESKLDKTGSYLAPYVTSIGIYSGLDLIAIAKLGQPIKLTGDYPMNFLVKLDF